MKVIVIPGHILGKNCTANSKNSITSFLNSESVPTTMSLRRKENAMAIRQPLAFEGLDHFLDTLFGNYFHTKLLKSLVDAMLGCIHSASLTVSINDRGPPLANLDWHRLT